MQLNQQKAEAGQISDAQNLMTVSFKLAKSGFDQMMLVQFKMHSETLVKNLALFNKFGSSLL